MKIEELKKIISETVHEAMQSEFREILLEAVEAVEKKNSAKSVQKPVVPVKKVTESTQRSSMADILNSTRANMSREEYNNIMGGGTERVDYGSLLSETRDDGKILEESSTVCALPDFVSRAKSIFEASKQKDIERNGVQG